VAVRAGVSVGGVVGDWYGRGVRVGPVGVGLRVSVGAGVRLVVAVGLMLGVALGCVAVVVGDGVSVHSGGKVG
jgi:hypothetical protein